MPPPQSTPILPLRRYALAPCSSAQRRLWFLQQLVAASGPAYNIAVSFRVSGPLDTLALAAALRALMDRHESLRTSIVTRRGEPWQRVAEGLDPPLRVVGCEPPERLPRLLRDEMGRPFDPAAAPLFRVLVAELGADDRVVAFSASHLICDGFSLGLFFDELEIFYAAHRDGRPLELAPLPLQYADFAAWERARYQDPAVAAELAQWTAELAGVPDSVPRPDWPRPPVQRFRGARWRAEIPAPVAGAVAAAAARLSATRSMIYLAAFQVLLARYAGRDEAIVGMPVAGRSRTELEQVIGLFAGTVPVRLSLSGDPAGPEVIAAARTATQRALSHQHLRFEELVERLGVPRDTGRNPVFQCLFSYQNAPGCGLRLPGLRTEPLRVDLQTATFDLGLELSESGTGTGYAIEYNTDLFRSATIRRLAGHYVSVLCWLTDPEQPPLSWLSLATAHERERVREFNDTAIAFSGPSTLDAMLAAQAARTPFAPCLIAPEGSLCYGDLWQRACELARLLRARGVRADSVAAVCLDRSLAQVVALTGVIAAGAAYLPLDPGHPPERLRLMLEQAAPAVVITTTGHAASLPAQAGAEIICMDHLALDESPPAERDWPPPEPGNLAYVIFTSGSTGAPKGVMISHRAIVNRLRWMQDSYRIGPADRVLQKTPCTFDVSVWEYFWPLTGGARLVVAAPGVHRDPAALAATMRRHRITVAHFVPTMLAEFTASDPADLPDLHTVFSSGEALPPDLARRFIKRFGVRLHNLYGPTEAAVDVTWHQCDEEEQAVSVPIGRPAANTTIHVLDRQLEPAPIGVPGELYLGGIQLARGYIGRPGLTAASLVPAPRPVVPGERLYRTGDLARWLDDGELEFLGRADGQVKIHGQRIELGEVECALRQHPDVAAAAAAVREMDGRPAALAGYLTLTSARRDPALIERELREMLPSRLPASMIPAYFCFLDVLPVSPNGKLDRGRLPDPGRPRAAKSALQAPRTRAERMVTEVWSDLLAADQVAVTDDFFALGGDSILAVQAVARLRERRLAVPLEAFFEQPTVERIAAVAVPLPGRDLGSRDRLPLTWAQASLLACRPGPAILESGWRPRQPRARLERALRALIIAQPALRLRVVTKNRGNGRDGPAFQYLADPDEQASSLPGIRWIADATHGAESAGAATAGEAVLLTVADRPADGLQALLLTVDRLLVSPDSLHLIGAELDRILGGNMTVQPADDDAFRAALASLAVPGAETRRPSPAAPASAPPQSGFQRATMPARLYRLFTETVGLYRCTAVDVLTAALAAVPCLAAHGCAEVEFADPRWPRGLAGPARRRLRVTTGAAAPLAALRAVKEQLRAVFSADGDGDAAGIGPAPVLLSVRDTRSRDRDETGGWTIRGDEPDELYAGRDTVLLVDLAGDAATVSVRCHRDSDANPVASAAAYLRGIAAVCGELCGQPASLYVPADFPVAPLPDAALSWLSARYPRLDDVYPLTPIQRQAVTCIADHPRDGLYTISVAFKLAGQQFDLAAFQHAWRVLMSRHAALRTSFLRLPGAGWMQAVHAGLDLPIGFEDISGLPRPEQDARVGALKRAACRHRFDLAAAPQWQMTVLRLGGDDYRVVCRLSYALQDGWSFSVLQEEWFDLYEAARSGREIELPALTPLRDHVEWLTHQDMDAARDYWRGALSALPGTGQVLGIPAYLRHPGPPDPSGEADLLYPSHGLRLDRVLQQRLRAYGRARRITFFTLIEAAWAITLAGLTGRQEVAFGTVSSGRSPQVPGAHRIYGPVNNILPIIVSVPDEPRGEAWLYRLQHEHATARQYEYASVGDIGQWLGARPGDPLVDNFMTFENFPQRPGLEQQMRDWHPDGGETQTEHALRLLLWPTTPMVIYISYYREHFDRPAVEGMLLSFVRNLEGLLSSADGPR